jgi:HlyD family secretion protein
VSGNISWLGADFNSIVRKGQVIARLDPSLFDAQLQQAKANLTQAQANLIKAQSDLERTKVQLTDAEQKYTRAKELAERKLLPQSDLDAAKIAVDTAQAQLESQEATVKQSQAQVAMSQATVNQNQVNLDHTIIEAPIDGIVTQRSVDVGQTVAASMQAPTLFIIAADLTKMQVNANIDEADVGRIRPGQHVTFRVDAYPSDTFNGTVSQIRLQPVVVQNVTTYGTIVDVPNDELKLKPGMTANLKVEISKRGDVLRIPNAALRFRPTVDLFAALNQTPPPELQYRGRGRGGRGGGRDTGLNAAGADATTPTGTPGNAPAGTAPGGTATGGNATTGNGTVGSGTTGNGSAGTATAGQSTNIGGADAGARGRPRRMTGRRDNAAAAPLSGAAAALRPKYGAPLSAQGVRTIDALFAPLPSVDSRGRVWLFIDHQLKPVTLRLGITDGQNTELLGTELQQGMEVVTGVTGLSGTRNGGVPQGSGNPLMPQRGRGPGR